MLGHQPVQCWHHHVRHDFIFLWLSAMSNMTERYYNSNGWRIPQDRLERCFDVLMQENRNSIANALESRRSCTNPSVWSFPSSNETNATDCLFPWTTAGDGNYHSLRATQMVTAIFCLVGIVIEVWSVSLHLFFIFIPQVFVWPSTLCCHIPWT